MDSPTRIVAWMELTAVSRLWWIRLSTVAYALMTVAMAQASAVAVDGEANETFARLTVALLPLALMLIPLVALLVGISTVSADPEAGAFLFGQPVSVRQVVVGRWLGQAAALTAAIVVGFGSGGFVVWANTAAVDVLRFVYLVGACVLLALAFLSVATLTASLGVARGTALGIVTFVWFVAVVLYDAAALGAAIWLTGRAGARLLFVSVFTNVVDLVRVLTLSVAGTPEILGAAGESWRRALGGSVSAATLAGAALLAWIAAPLAAAVRISSVRDC